MGCFKRINAFLVFFACFHKTTHNKWCLRKIVGQIESADLERGFVKLFLTTLFPEFSSTRAFGASESPGNGQIVVWSVLYFTFFVVCSFCFYVKMLTVLRNRNKWNKLKNSLILSFRVKKSSWKNILRCTERVKAGKTSLWVLSIVIQEYDQSNAPLIK